MLAMSDELLRRRPLTRAQLVESLSALGVGSANTIMLHCSLSSMGYVVGGSDTVVTALLDAVGADGTVMALAGWDHDSYHLQEWPEPLRVAYLADPPGFDPIVSEAARYVGRLPERIRTWPGATSSNHPEARFVAVGLWAEWITKDQPLNHPYGRGSPLAKLVEADGHVLLLGAPLNTITLLHHAEELADVSDKKIVRYHAPVASGQDVEWLEIEDIDTSTGAFPYHQVVGERDSFDVIGEAAIAARIGTAGKVGDARSFLFPARHLVAFAVAWMEKHFT
jgi:aminoglycoside 3-N-acetyltransferase